MRIAPPPRYTMKFHPTTAEFAKLDDDARSEALAKLRAIVEFVIAYRLRQAQQFRHCDRASVDQSTGYN